MSLLDRLGRPNQVNVQVRIFASLSDTPIDNSYQEIKQQIHRHLHGSICRGYRKYR